MRPEIVAMAASGPQKDAADDQGDASEKPPGVVEDLPHPSWMCASNPLIYN